MLTIIAIKKLSKTVSFQNLKIYSRNQNFLKSYDFNLNPEQEVTLLVSS